MLLSSLFTYRVGPVLQLDALSHFLTFVREKIEVLVSIHNFSIYGDAHSKTRGSAKKFFLRFYFNYILFYLIIQEKKIFVYNTLIKKFFIEQFANFVFFYYCI